MIGVVDSFEVVDRASFDRRKKARVLDLQGSAKCRHFLPVNANTWPTDVGAISLPRPAGRSNRRPNWAPLREFLLDRVFRSTQIPLRFFGNYTRPFSFGRRISGSIEFLLASLARRHRTGSLDPGGSISV